MAKNKTTETLGSVAAFINAVEDETKRSDSFRIIELIETQTGFKPKMWGSSIVGFGSYHYKYESGREGDAPLVGFSPRKPAIVFYLSGSFDKRAELLEKLGKHKTEKGCVYVKKLADVDTNVLRKIIVASVKHIKVLYADKKK